MGGLLGKLVSGLGGNVIEQVGNVIDKFVTTGEEKLKAQQELVSIQLAFDQKMAELDQAWAAQQAEVIKAEANSASWLARNWRPLLMLVFTYIVAHNYVVAPIFSVASVPIPPDMWELLKIGMGGYIVGRSLEKVAPAVADVVTSKKK